MSNATPNSARSSLAFDITWLGFCLIAVTAWCWTSAHEIGVTFDEPIYMERGLEHWRTGSSTELMKLGTMPLPVDLATLPAYVHEQSRGRSLDLESEFFTALIMGRMTTVIFFWVLLIYAWLNARMWGGPWAGRIAVGLLAFEPTFLAHSALATTDIAITGMLLAFVYHFTKNRDNRWAWRVLWPGVWFGLAILCKASGLVFGGLCMLAIDWHWRRNRNIESDSEDKPAPTFRSSFKDMFQIGLVGLAVTFIYCGSDFGPQESFFRWAHELPEGPLANVMVPVSENFCVFSNAGDGIVRQFRHNMRGHGVYLLGVNQKRALWYYFPVALSIKLAIPIMIALLLLIITRFLRPGGKIFKQNGLLVCALVLVAFLVLCRVQIGIRLVLPIVAILVVAVSSSLAISLQNLRGKNWSRFVNVVMVGGILWMMFTAARIWPDGLTYINPAWAATNDDYKLLSDANFDWGQGIGDLQRWENEHPQANLSFWYYGQDPRVKSLQAEPIELHTLPVEEIDDFEAHVAGRQIAVSTSLVYGSLWNAEVHRARDFLRQYEPADRTKTFLIYDFTETDAQAD